MSITAPNLSSITSGELAKIQADIKKLEESSETSKTPNQTTTDKKGSSQKYCGLSNQGATCYMNSVLQALFMTPEFRRAIFKWRYDEKEHGKPEYCIPFQLQKLYAHLQLKLSNHTSTKGLTRSFNWDTGNAFQQQDIQEFYTVFCDAIEQTTKHSEIDGCLQEIFGGTIVNYIECKEHGFESTRSENFVLLTMTVKNPWEKIYNDSLEKALQIYLKPELLTGDNQYFLEEKKQKVDAVKGIKFLKLPKVLGVILNRFSFDYFSMKREKLDDFVSFPFVLNMNRYLEGYEGIQDKIQEVNEQYFKETPKTYKEIKELGLKKSTPVVKSGISAEQYKAATTSTGSKTDSTSPPRSIQDEIKRMRRGNDVDVIVYSEELNEIVTVRESAIEDPDKVAPSQSNPQSTESSQKNPQESQEAEKDANPSVRAHTTDLDAVAPKKRIVYGQPTQDDDYQEFYPELLEDVTQPEAPLLQELKDLKNNPPKFEEVKKLSELAEAEAEKSKQEKIDREKKYSLERTAEIEKYLKEGPLVYDLYAILVHMGGAYGGHYYAFIKSFEDGFWYRFDDSSVTRMDPEEIPVKAFGGGKAANAYKLLYRQVEKAEEEFETIADDLIPEELRAALEAERLAEEIAEAERVEKMNKINVRIHYRKDVKLVPTNLKETLDELLEKALKEYNILSFPRHNIRLRVYQPTSETMQDTFTGKQKKTLEELRITSQKNLIIETKEDHEEFMDYDIDSILFKISYWRNSLVSLEEKELQLRPILVSRKAFFGELVLEVAKRYELAPEKVRICKKQYLKGHATAEIISKEENMGKTFVELKLFENMILYVEEIDSQESSSKWAVEFEKDSFRCKIRFNNPYKEVTLDYGVEFDGIVVVDIREPLQRLKEEIGAVLHISTDEFIMKKGGKMGLEVKDLSRSIESENYVNGASLYIEFGKPAKSGEFRLQFFYARKIVPEIDSFSHKFEPLCDLSVDGELKASGLKVLIATALKEKLGIETDPRRIRLRERVSERMTKIYKDVSMKSQHLVDKKQIAVEVLDYDDIAGHDDVLVIVRKWDGQTFELSPRVEFVVNKFICLKLFAELILTKFPDSTFEDLMGTKILAPWSMNRYALGNENWSSLNEEKNVVGDHPFYFSNDGFMLVVRDKSQPIRELDPQQQKELGIVVAKSMLTESKSLSGGGYALKESGGVKIRIKTKEDQEREEQERKQKAEEDKKDSGQQSDPIPVINQEFDALLDEEDLCPLGDF